MKSVFTSCKCFDWISSWERSSVKVCVKAALRKFSAVAGGTLKLPKTHFTITKNCLRLFFLGSAWTQKKWPPNSPPPRRRSCWSSGSMSTSTPTPSLSVTRRQRRRRSVTQELFEAIWKVEKKRSKILKSLFRTSNFIIWCKWDEVWDLAS